MKIIKKYIHDIYSKAFLNNLSELKLIQHELLNTQRLAPLFNNYIPWTSSSMSPSAIVTILNEIVINSRECVVECGSGISTLFIAKIFNELGNGHIYTIEHDQTWIEVIENILKREGLDKFVSIIYAPLVSTDVSLDKSQWYNTQPINEKLSDKEVDLIIVDGPPGHKKEIMYSRYPAVPYLKNFFADSFTIILDDCNRIGESEIVTRWEEILSIRFEKHLLKGNIAIGKSKPSFTI